MSAESEVSEVSEKSKQSEESEATEVTEATEAKEVLERAATEWMAADGDCVEMVDGGEQGSESNDHDMDSCVLMQDARSLEATAVVHPKPTPNPKPNPNSLGSAATAVAAIAEHACAMYDVAIACATSVDALVHARLDDDSSAMLSKASTAVTEHSSAEGGVLDELETRVLARFGNNAGRATGVGGSPPMLKVSKAEAMPIGHCARMRAPGRKRPLAEDDRDAWCMV